MSIFQVLPPDQPVRSETNMETTLISTQAINFKAQNCSIVENLKNWQSHNFSSFSGTIKTIYRKPNFLSSIQLLKFYHRYLHNNGPGEWFWHLNGHGNQSNNNDFVRNLNFHFLDLTVTFGDFDLYTCDCSHKII